MEQSIAILRNQLAMISNAITAAGFAIKHVDNTFTLEPIKTKDEETQQLKSKQSPKPK